MSVIKQILIILFCCTYSIVLAQEIKIKTPKKAALCSAILPGSGQFYTKNYWKIPVIYAGLITSAFYINKNNESYLKFKNAYLNRIAGDNSDEFQTQYSNSDLKLLINNSRRNREISVLCLVGSYILNIIDASVGAHLFNYDVSDNLSLNIKPIYLPNENKTGLSLSFNL